mmetsp:Transcript_77962/g.137413  ORF Transcript_77962/g.137413 Transcript_77962/m.137413 type:complete len:235 (+) Transcript_77962:51-755(+)
MQLSLFPLSACCCGCSTTTGTFLILLGHLACCLGYVTIACCHWIWHQATWSSTWSAELQMLLVMFFLTGIPIIGGALYGTVLKLEVHVRSYLFYLLASFAVDTGLMMWGFLIKDACQTVSVVVHSLGSIMGDAFTCGIVRICSYFSVALMVLVEVYCLWVVWSFCEDIRAGKFGPELSELILGQEALVIKHKQEPLKSRTARQYGSFTVEGNDGIFKSVSGEHETNYPAPRGVY